MVIVLESDGYGDKALEKAPKSGKNGVRAPTHM
jgi:hypothetical protein